VKDLGGFFQIGCELPLRSGEGKNVLNEEIDVHGKRVLGVNVVLEKGQEIV
jgi:hypothetical protein